VGRPSHRRTQINIRTNFLSGSAGIVPSSSSPPVANHAPEPRRQAQGVVDYSGKKVPIVDPLTGEIRMAEIFIGVLGALTLTYAEASWTQALPDWIGAHVRMFRFYGRVPRFLAPDNLKSGVNKASFYDPRSTGPMVPWRRMTASACCQRGRESRRTRRPSRLGSASPNITSSAGCGT
jgi:hypothetical protein